MEYEGAIVDLDGTIYRGDSLLPGAAEFLARLRDAGVRPLFFSNNPTKSRQEYVERLAGLGLDVAAEEVLSAGTVTTQFLASNHADDAVFLVGAPGLRRQFQAASLDVVADATDADVLVVSWTREFDYGDMLAGYRALEAGAAFYGTDPDRLIPTADGMVPGSGSLINAVGGVAEVEPERILGKPSEEARRAALEAIGVPAPRCFVVGDRLDTDVVLGERAGMTTVLVRTGVTADTDLAESAHRPDVVVDSLADLGRELGL